MDLVDDVASKAEDEEGGVVDAGNGVVDVEGTDQVYQRDDGRMDGRTDQMVRMDLVGVLEIWPKGIRTF